MEDKIVINGKYANYICNAKQHLSNRLKSDLRLNKDENIAIVKRNTRLKEGDFLVHIPRHVVRFKDTPDQHESLITLGSDWKVCVRHVSTTTEFTNAVYLERKELFSKLIQDVISMRQRFGLFLCKNATILLNNSFVHTTEKQHMSSDLTLCQIRAALLCQHISQVLNTLGFSVEHVHNQSLPDHFISILQQFGYITKKSCNESSTCKTSELLQQQITKCQHRCTSPDSSGESGSKSLLNLRDFIISTNQPTGKDGFDANIKTADFSNGTDRFAHLLALELSASQLNPVPTHCIHVASYKQLFNQQVIDLGWKMLSPNGEKVKQVHVQYGPVSARKSADKTELPFASNFLQLRKQQMKDSFLMKYGEQVNSAKWESTINALTMAAIKFEFLTTNSRSELKLDIRVECENGASIDKGGVFVMYNCARLATLFDNFEKAVQAKTYPPLKPINEIDFACLREEEEWALLFNYVFTFPDLVENFLTVMRERKPIVNFPTHKVCQFLLDLCRDFSSYYNRVHILGEPREHLMDMMHARLYLLKSIQQVMHNALALLNIEPISQL